MLVRAEIILMVVSIATGALGRRLGIFSSEDGNALSKIVLTIFLPCTTILSLMKIEKNMFGEMIEILLATIVLFLLSLGILGTVSKIVFRKNRKIIPVMVLNGTFGNGGFMGIPIALAVYGCSGVQRLLFSNLAFAIIFWTIGVYICVLYGSGEFSSKLAARELVRNPVTISTFIGLLFGLTEIQLPASVFEFMDVLNRATVPLSMVAIGMFLETSSFRSYLLPSLFNAIFKFLVSPTLALLIAHFLDLSMMNTEILLLQALMPPAVLNTILLSRYSLNAELSSAITVVNTLVSLPIIFAIILI